MNNVALGWVRKISAALITAFVAALIVHLVTILLFFLANNANSEILGQLSEFFLPASLLFFVLLAVVIGFDGLRRWYATVPLAVLISVLSAMFGSFSSIVNQGAELNSQALAFLFSSLIGVWMIFIIVASLITIFLARRIWSKLSGSTLDAPPSRDRKIALVRLPASNLAEGQVTHIARSVINSDKADEEWDGYVSALIENDWDIVEVPVAAEAPDSVFVEDTVVIFGDTAVITSPGHESRRSEITAVEATVRELGLRVEQIKLPGTLDGGDVLKVGKTVYVGRSGRTNGEGIRQLRAIVSKLGYQLVPVKVTKVLHLKSAVTALPDGTIIGYPKNVDNPAVFPRFLAVPEETGTAVVMVNDDTLLISAAAPKTTAMLEDLGYRMIPVEISEFEKLEGCVTCLSVRIR